MTNEYELADSSPRTLIYTKEQLLSGLAETMVTPHGIFPGTGDRTTTAGW